VTYSLHTYSAVPLQALRATTDLPAGQVQVSGGPKEFHIAVTYTPQSAGEITGEICLQPWDLWGQRLPERRAQICGWAREEVEAWPMRILLGAVPLGKDCQETIILQSQRGMPFEVTGWEAPANCRIEPASTRSADPTCRYYHLQLRIARPGQQQIQVRFRIAMGKDRIFDAPVTMVYYGLPSQGTDAVRDAYFRDEFSYRRR
jgi:hypothetical protein